MPKIKVNDINMYYEIQGEGEPLVLIAGFSVDHTTWQSVVDIFKKNFQVIVFDNRGAGQTDAPIGQYSIAQMADDTAKLCAALNITNAHFIGNSMGGFILQYLARHYAHLVKSATISNSALTIECVFHLYVAAQLQFIKANAPVRALIIASCSWAFSYDFLMQRNMLEAMIALGLNNPYPFTLAGYEGQYAALDVFDSRAFAPEINVPTLVVSGDEDKIFSEPTTKALADAIPHSTYHCFKTCGHLPMVEYPEQFAAIVTQWIMQDIRHIN